MVHIQLYWSGRGASARLTVATTPTPVDAVLVQAARMITPSHANYGDLQAAQAKQSDILKIKTRVEGSRHRPHVSQRTSMP